MRTHQAELILADLGSRGLFQSEGSQTVSVLGQVLKPGKHEASAEQSSRLNCRYSLTSTVLAYMKLIQQIAQQAQLTQPSLWCCGKRLARKGVLAATFSDVLVLLDGLNFPLLFVGCTSMGYGDMSISFPDPLSISQSVTRSAGCSTCDQTHPDTTRACFTLSCWSAGTMQMHVSVVPT